MQTPSKRIEKNENNIAVKLIPLLLKTRLPFPPPKKTHPN